MKRKVIIIGLLIFILVCSFMTVNRRIYRSIYTNTNNYLTAVYSSGDNYLNIDNFMVDSQNNIIYDIPLYTTVSDFLENVDTNGEIEFFDCDEEPLEEDDNLSTTDMFVVTFDGDEDEHVYTLSILGDVFGEGSISMTALYLTASHIIDGNVLDGIELLSADYNQDGDIKMNDVMLMLLDYEPDEITITANFIALNSSLTEVSSEEESCTITYGDMNGCQIQVPYIAPAAGYTAVGFSVSDSTFDNVIESGSTITIYGPTNYYAVIKKTFTAQFEVLDDNAATISTNSVSCDAYNGATECDVTFPSVEMSDGYELVGFSTDSGDTTSNIYGENIMALDGNRTYYLITKKTITVYFDGDVEFDYNNVGVGEDGYNYAKTNIAADALSFAAITCDSYNGEGCYIDDLPKVYSSGNEIRGFALLDDPQATLRNVLEIKNYEDVTYYARIFNYASEDDFVVGYEDQIDNVVIEFEEGLSANLVIGYMSYLEQLAEDMPELFVMKGKIRMFSQTTYELVYGRLPVSYANSAGATSILYASSLVDIKLKNLTSVEEYRKGTLVHELAHALDGYYGTMTRNFDSGKITNESDVIGLYNYYMNQSPRPLRDYSYSAIAEFWADSNRWYYSEEFNRFDNQATMSTVTEYQPATEELKEMVRKYSCIVNNDFDKEAICS